MNFFSDDYTGTAAGPTTQVPERFQPLWNRLTALKNKDSQHKVFGASKHHYRSIRVTEEEMCEFEAWCGVTLPDSYRDYLIHVGHGSGPYYGIWNPAKSRSEILCCLADWDAESRQNVHTNRPFPYSVADAQKTQERRIAGEKEHWIKSTWPIDGCIPICHQGCTYWSVLVIAGECAGRMWDVACDDPCVGLWLPSARPSGSVFTKARLLPLPDLSLPPTFEEWLLSWIERAMTDLGAEESTLAKSPRQ